MGMVDNVLRHVGEHRGRGRAMWKPPHEAALFEAADVIALMRARESRGLEQGLALGYRDGEAAGRDSLCLVLQALVAATQTEVRHWAVLLQIEPRDGRTRKQLVEAAQRGFEALLAGVTATLVEAERGAFDGDS